MSTVVIKVGNDTFQKIQAAYASYRLPKSAPYTVFTAKKNSVTITGYTSGKVMFQGTTAETEAAKWQTSVSDVAKKTTKAAKLPADFQKLSVIGSDEVGNGSYFGPLSVCAAYAAKAVLPELKALGVKDSKLLTDPQIRKLAKKLLTLIPYRLLVVAPAKYNQIQPQYNAVRMKVALHNQAIRLLLDDIAPIKPDAILIDQFTPETNYYKYLKLEKQPITEKLYFETKGEQYHLAVAAASIISRASFLDSLDQASKELGFAIPSGAGAKSDQVAAKILQKGGRNLLANYAKLHFANTEKAQRLLQK